MKKLFTERLVTIALTTVLVLVASVPSVYFYKKYQSMKQPQKQDITSLVSKVSKIILLPAGEQPTVMVVTDKTKLSSQSFFTNAKNGDQVLIYTKAKKAFLYDPDANKIIEVGPIVIATPTPTTPSAVKSITVPVTIVPASEASPTAATQN